jgi:hypothetical protein
MSWDYRDYLIIEDCNYQTSSYKKVYYKRGGKYLGDFVQDVDGFYRYFPSGEDKGYCYSQEHLEMLFRALKDLNQEWEDIINEEMSKIPDFSEELDEDEFF